MRSPLHPFHAHATPPARPRRPWRVIGRLARGGALVVLASCGDQFVAPPPAPDVVAAPTPTIYDPWSAMTFAEQITATRTTETFEIRGGRRVSKGRTTKVSKLARDVAIVGPSGRAPAPARPVAGQDVSSLPPAGLNVETRRGGITHDGPWKKRKPLVGVPGVEVETEGVGDSPALTLRYYQNGALARVVTQKYTRGVSDWELVHREIASADGTLRDVLTVERTGRRMAPPTPLGGSLAAESDFGRIEPLDGTNRAQVDCDPCKALREARDAAFESVLWLDAAAVLICTLTPPPANVLACLAAGLKVIEAFSKFVRADIAYDRCAANPPRCPDDEPPPPSGGGGGGDNGGGTTTCYYEVWYDGDTGEVIHSELLYCVTT